MDDDKCLYSVLNDKGLGQSSYANGDKNSSNMNLINQQKKSGKKESFVSRKSRHSFLNTFKQLNLKVVAEDIKHKLFEMNKNSSDKQLEITEQYNKEINKENIKNTSSLIKHTTKKSSKNKSILKKQKKDITNKPLNKEEENKEEGDSNEYQIKEAIKTNKRVKFRDSLKLKRNKLRRLIRVKNLCDSNDDDESDTDDEQYVIDPETKAIAIFDFFIIFFFIYYFFYTTVQLCSERCYCSSNEHITFSELMLIINDILCFADFFLSFFRGYYNYNYELVKTNKLILNNYFKNDFSFDLLSAIPFFSISQYLCFKEGFHYYECLKYEIPTRYLLLRLFSLFKTVKIKKILGHKKNQALDKLSTLISENYTLERVCSIISNSLIYIGIFHFFVCFHIFIGNHSYSNWLILTQSEDKSLFHVYITSLYFLITTLTTVGYGDITCQSLLERIFQIVILAIGSVFYPYVVSSIGNLIENDSNAKIKQHNDLAMLENIRINYPNLSFKLYSDIYKYLESKGTSLKKYDINSFIETLPFALKNNILFSMYRTTITNFKFFSQNNNSIFIAEVLNHFIPSTSKKNDFLIVEGEMLEEILFLRDGKISLNAAIEMEDQFQSIIKYYTENFQPFFTKEEKNFIAENTKNLNLKDTTIKPSIIEHHDKNLIIAKMKSNQSLKTVKQITNKDDKTHQQINDLFKKIEIPGQNKKEEKNNEDDAYHYLKIIDIRKNEHFGVLFLTMNKPVPLSLQVKSKIVDLFLLKKDDALKISKNYSNIWRNIYEKEYQNFMTIKHFTFSFLNKYIKENKLFFNKKYVKNFSNFDLNFFENFVSFEKNLKKKKRQNGSISKGKLPRNNTVNYQFNNAYKTFGINIIGTNSLTKRKNTMDKKSPYTFIIKKNNLQKNNNFGLTNINSLNRSSVLFSTSAFNNDMNATPKNNEYNILNSLAEIKNKVSYEMKKEENNIFKQKTKKEKLKNLKNFLIECKKYFMNNKYSNNNTYQRIHKSEKNLPISKNNIKKSCFKKMKLELNPLEVPYEIKIKSDIGNQDINKIEGVNELINLSNKNNEKSDLKSFQEKSMNMESSKFPESEQLLKNLECICEEETDFSFCSTSDEMTNFKKSTLTIDRNNNFEILSSYPNLNKIAKGNFIKDYHLQKRLKLLLKKYYQYKKETKKIKLNDPIFLRTIEFLSGSENEKFKSKNKSKFKNKKSKTIKENVSHNKRGMNKIFEELTNEKNKPQRISLATKKLLITEEEFKNNLNVSSNTEKQNNEIANIESIKVHKSDISSLSKKSENERSEIFSNKNSVGINIKKNVNIYNSKEIEYIIDAGINQKINNENILMDNTSNKSINYKIYKGRTKKKKYHNHNKALYDDKSKELINQVLGIKIPTTNNIITTTSNMKDSKNEFNSIEKMKNIENVSIYNIIHKNINKNLNIIDNNEKGSPRNYDRSFCCIT